MNQQEIDLYKEVYDSMYAGLEKLKPGNTTADVAAQFPKYDDDMYGTCTLQQFAHCIGLTLYEGMWMSRGYSLKYPAEIKENMYFAIETFAGHPGLRRPRAWKRTCWCRARGPVVFTQMEHMEETGCKWEPKHGICASYGRRCDGRAGDVELIPVTWIAAATRCCRQDRRRDYGKQRNRTPEAILEVARDADAF